VCHAPQEKLGEEYVLKKKGRGKGRKSTAAPAADAAELSTETAGPKTPKPKRKRAAGTAHLVKQEGWPVQPRTLWPLPDDFALSRSAMKGIVKEVSASEYASPFLVPVDPEEAPGYSDMIETPMDLGKSAAELRYSRSSAFSVAHGFHCNSLSPGVMLRLQAR
jgi:hypothetical protein